MIFTDIRRPLVSAIITTHNRLSLLPRAIESVLTQTYDNIECIVVSDACNDGTEEYCKGIKDIKYIAISKAESKGGNHARNIGIEASSGEFVAFLDDDDYWLPTKIEKQVMLAIEKDSGFIYCPRRLEIIEDSVVNYHDETCNKNNTGDVSNIVLYTIITTTSCVLTKRDLLYEIGLFDEKLCFWQETELGIRMAQKTPYYFVPECLTVYRVDPKDKARLTGKYIPWIESVKYIYNKHKKLYLELTNVEFLRYLLMVWKDALHRTRNAKLTEKEKYFQTLINKGVIIANEELRNRKPWHYFPLFLDILWYVKRRELTIESRLLRISIRFRKYMGKETE